MKLPRAWASLAALTVVLAACGSDDAENGIDEADAAEAGETADSDAGDAAFPVTIGAGDGAIELTEAPQRIVTLSATATEMLFAIGAGDLVVAADEYSNYPDDAPTTDLSGFDPNVEAIAGFDPDLVIASSDPGELAASLDQLGVPTLIHPAALTIDDTYAQIEQLGVATGSVGDAAELVAQMQSDIDAIIAEAGERDEPLTYYHELDPNFYSVTSQTFIGNVYSLIGMESIADAAEDESGGYPQLSPEFIVQSDPDLILLADAACCGVDAAEVSGRAGWDQLTAVQEGRIIELDEDIASRWGPRIVDFLQGLVADVSALQPVQ
jgi:iron complex transport system substrate-binding protein